MRRNKACSWKRNVFAFFCHYFKKYIWQYYKVKHSFHLFFPASAGRLEAFFIQILFQLSGANTFQTNQVIPSSGAVVTAVTVVCLPWQPYQQCINKQVRDGGICLWMGAGEDSEQPISFWNRWELGSHTGWDVRNYQRNAICVQSQQGHLSCREKKRLNLII